MPTIIEPSPKPNTTHGNLFPLCTHITFITITVTVDQSGVGLFLLLITIILQFTDYILNKFKLTLATN